jgi:hypothetical protein
MVEATLEAAAAYPDKRLVAHFVQPHYPFLDEAPEGFEGSQTSLAANQVSPWDRVIRGDLQVSVDEAVVKRRLERLGYRE